MESGLGSGSLLLGSLPQQSPLPGVQRPTLSAGIPGHTPKPLPPLPMSPESMPDRLQSLGRFGLRALRIAASTLSIVELLRSNWTGGIGAGLAWLVFLQVERRLPPRAPKANP